MWGGPPNMAFDRTYEGLKHEPGHPQGHPVGAFDRTYEGLKPTTGTVGRP